MEVVIIALLVIGLVIGWLALDLYLGRKKHLKEVQRLKFPKRQGEISLYADGNLLYKDLFQDMREANHHIHSLFYMVRNDDDSQEFLHILKDKARQGVEVRLLMDYFGSFDVKKETIENLKKHNVQVEYYHKPAFPFFFSALISEITEKSRLWTGKSAMLVDLILEKSI